MNRRSALGLFGKLGLFGMFVAVPKAEAQDVEFERGHWYCGLCKTKIKSEINYHSVSISTSSTEDRTRSNMVASFQPTDKKCPKCGSGLFVMAQPEE